MKDFIHAATSGTGGAAITSAATGQLVIAGLTFVCFLGFGVWGAYWKYRDSKAIREAIEAGDLKAAVTIRNK